MKVFISWSGTRSNAIGEVLRNWLPIVLQAVRPYFSQDDVEKGSRWSSELSRELRESQVGLLVVTPENQNSPRLLFEAGALSNSVDQSKVCPILFGGLEPRDLQWPLAQFQAAKFSRDEMTRVIKTLNMQCGGAGLSPDILSSVLRKWWPDLEEQITQKLALPVPDDMIRPSDGELLDHFHY